MKIKSIAVFFVYIFVLLPLIAYSGSSFKDQKAKIRGDLTERRETDKAYREKVIKDVKAHMEFINKQLAFGSKSQIEIPIELDKIEDMNKDGHQHSKEKIPPKEYGFINDDYVNFRIEPRQKSRSIGKFSFQEKVELIIKSEETEKIDGVEERWILVRRDNGEEGWVFATFLAKNKPEKTKRDIERQTQPDDKKSEGQISDSFIVPTEGFRSSSFGYRVHPVTKKAYTFHSGIDIACPTGTPVKAASDGSVIRSEFNKNGYGNLIILQHEEDVSTYYAHLSKRVKTPGDKVKKGELIGEVGSTGMSTGPHLHFEVRRGGNAMNPDQYLR
jgi:murein DD-endopeptidase MepM/ murein hydrolase activator NlpD